MVSVSMSARRSLAAAVGRQGRVDVCALGTHGAVIPSVLLLREDGSQLFGESADRRAVTESARVAREFKRRFGDSTPAVARRHSMLTRGAHRVVDRPCDGGGVDPQGEQPAALCITHPANWGTFKTDLLHHAIRLAGVTCPVTYATEPVAAAVHFGHSQRLAPGSRVAVYDLGGGTFDAAVLECTPTGFEILGHPEGIERLGGVDIDAAVFNHVVEVLGKSRLRLRWKRSRSVSLRSRQPNNWCAAGA
jgi:molecular chaperone DnaK